jgi:hypothetical protein
MKFERLAVLGTLGVCGGVIATYALLAWLATPTPYGAAPGATGGIDGITRTVLCVAALIPTSIFVWSHLAFAKQIRNGRSSLND